MAIKTISVRVSDKAAQAYESASPDARRKLDALISLQLSETTRSTRSLEEIMDDISRKAEARGLTPEILAEILDDEA